VRRAAAPPRDGDVKVARSSRACDDLTTVDLEIDQLFRDPEMFRSRDRWRDAGFEVLGRSSDSKIMVARHASAPGVLFKKYADEITRKEQIENYERRVEGASRVRDLIAARGLRGVVAPKKRIVKLPHQFAGKKRSSYVLVVEQIPILSEDASRQAYKDIDEDTLHDVIVVLWAFRGLDSTVKNVPFTARGQVAFIDTEHWNRHADRDRRDQRPFLKYIGEYLSRDSRALAKRIVEKLEDAYD
jgi:hypothetical protein